MGASYRIVQDTPVLSPLTILGFLAVGLGALLVLSYMGTRAQAERPVGVGSRRDPLLWFLVFSAAAGVVFTAFVLLGLQR